jgi:hypothetical protein
MRQALCKRCRAANAVAHPLGSSPSETIGACPTHAERRSTVVRNVAVQFVPCVPSARHAGARGSGSTARQSGSIGLTEPPRRGSLRSLRWRLVRRRWRSLRSPCERRRPLREVDREALVVLELFRRGLAPEQGDRIAKLMQSLFLGPQRPAPAASLEPVTRDCLHALEARCRASYPLHRC